MKILSMPVWMMLMSLPCWADTTAEDIIQKALDQSRGSSSYGQIAMTIKRLDWDRTITISGWTKGEDLSLIRVIAPAKDAGNATLTKHNEMWTFSPKINRVLKIPSSMMNQSWMGSDFSNNDVSKSNDIIKYYKHRLLASVVKDGHTVHTIESIPHDDAPVVWGREVLEIRDDYVMISHAYYDQENVLVKTMTTTKIATMGGKDIAKTMRVSKTETPEQWTELDTQKVEFDINIPDYVFTLSNLRNPRE